MDIIKQLEKLGLTEKEAKIYHICLKLGEATAFKIAKTSGIKRATVYFTLELLEEKGWISIRETKKVKQFIANDPERISNLLEIQRKTMQSLLPGLKEIYSFQFQQPKIQMLEGENGIYSIYDELLEFFEKGEEVLIFGTITHLDDPVFKSLLGKWRNLLKKGLKAREIINYSKTSQEYYEDMKPLGEKNKDYEIKMLPDEYLFSNSEVMIYGNKVAIISHQPEGIFAVSIIARHIVDLYQVWFKLAWKATNIA